MRRALSKKTPEKKAVHVAKKRPTATESGTVKKERRGKAQGSSEQDACDSDSTEEYDFSLAVKVAAQTSVSFASSSGVEVSMQFRRSAADFF